MDLTRNIDRLREAIRERRRAALKPPPRMTVDEWADTYRRLSRSAGSTGGRFRTATVEVARGPMRAASEKGVRKLTVLSATQLMKTTVLENILGYHCHLDPAPMLLLQPKEQFAEAFVKERVTPMVQGTPELLRAFGGRAAFKTRSSDNTLSFKRFSGGFLAVSSAGSPTNLAMRAIRVVLMDEIDKYSATKEGDPVLLAEERTETFPMNSLSVRVCSPTVTGHSRIEAEYLRSDQRKAYVPCPHCAHEFHLQWSDVHFKDAEGRSDPSIAAIVCPGCGTLWSEADRRRVLTTPHGIRWRQTRSFTCCDLDQHPEDTRNWDADGRALCTECGKRGVSNQHAGFRASALYSPWGSLEKLVSNWLACMGDRERLKAFTNTRLAETFAEDVEEGGIPEPDQLAARVEPPWPGVPDGVKIITAGFDVQGDRLEGEIVGWGDGDESWSLDYVRLEGDPSQDHVWRALDELLQTPLHRTDGTPLYIQACCVDAGYLTDSVVAFARPRLRRHVYAIKSASEEGGARKPIWPRHGASKASNGGQIYSIGSLSAKDRIEKHLGAVQPGPGYMHVPGNRDRTWFDMITAERRVIVMRNGRPASIWKKRPGRNRNEALDTRVYAIAALESLRSRGVRLPVTAPGTGAPDPASASGAPTAPAPRKRKRSGSGFWS